MITRRNKTYLERGLVCLKRGLADLDRILLNKDKLSNLVSFVQNHKPKKLCEHDNSNQFSTVTRWPSKKPENHVKTDPKLGTIVSKSAQNLGMCGRYVRHVCQTSVIRHQNQNLKKLCGHENSNQFSTVTRWPSKKLENHVKTDPKLGTIVSKSAQNLGMCGCYLLQNQNLKKLCGHENSNQFSTVTRWPSKKLENYVKTDPKLGTTVSKSAQNLGICGCYLLQVCTTGQSQNLLKILGFADVTSYRFANTP
ncbi:hypothetical protein QE152_g37050 [Popillia japonica]|uniref:WxxW domain-containing protein n=1 Tax=Popillia japonica TaxID=7064 RepID=A0AAW1IB54_POPJA